MSELALIYVDSTKHVLGAVLHLGTYGNNPDPKTIVGDALPFRDGNGVRALMLPAAQLKVKILDPNNVDKPKLVQLLADAQGFYLDKNDTPELSAPAPTSISATSSNGVVTVTLSSIDTPPQQLLCAVQNLAFPADATVPAAATFDATSKQASLHAPLVANQPVLLLVTGLRPAVATAT